ncbi:MAG: iron-containing alcohol dehydrogenase, partial [Candidatus Omnitrophica bacterium]|nr:iron-containing alcohol dehydrogenase [Candidatus Omnitrophota bacterium]
DLPVKAVWQAEIESADEQHWEAISGGMAGDYVLAAGGGLAVDAAKYIAGKKNLPLACIPTALTVDAFFTRASGVRRNGCVVYLETKTPDKVVMDLALLAKAPPALRAAGICDVLSIATGNWDWEYAHKKNKLDEETRFIPYISANARSILLGALDCAEAAGRGDPAGLKQLIDCLALEVQLCNQIGHSRPEEGSEHYFAYSMENLMGPGLTHGELVGPGILLMAEMQGQDTRILKKALTACSIPLNKAPAEAIQTTLRELPDYCIKNNLPFGIAHEIHKGL